MINFGFVMKNLKILLIPSIILLWTQTLGEVRCLKGNNPSQQELDEIKAFNHKFEKEMLELGASSHQNPENNELKAQFEQKNSLLAKKIDEVEKTWATIEIEEKNLDNCAELKLSPDEFNKLMENWKLMAMHYPNNYDYVYNHKLLTAIMLKQ
jgi:hypothetical protein